MDKELGLKMNMKFQEWSGNCKDKFMIDKINKNMELAKAMKKKAAISKNKSFEEVLKGNKIEKVEEKKPEDKLKVSDEARSNLASSSVTFNNAKKDEVKLKKVRDRVRKINAQAAFNKRFGK